MQHMTRMRKRNSFADFLKDSQTLRHTSEFFALLIKPSALHQFHGVKHASIGQSANVVYRDNSRMLQLRDNFCFEQQSCSKLAA